MRTLSSVLTTILLLIISCAPDSMVAQAADHERPRVGLVLGGGGARGAAHVGVLKELERLRIPVDAIAGTSMGAIVGGLYASGRTPEELEALVNSIDWADAFIDSPQRRNLTYRRKQDDAAYPAKLELGVGDGELLIPKGFIHGQKLHMILREQLLPVAFIDDFDELPTPFRAVASDLATGEPHVMAEGDLALALRASMSAPGIFSPVVVGERTLVDGGLVGNVPVDVIRDMDVDVIIAVDVEFPLYAPDRLESALEITEQMLTILIRKETRRQLSGLASGDILIRPDLGDYASTNFDDIADVIEPGQRAAEAMEDRLSELSLGEAEYRAYQVARRKISDEEERIDFVRVVDTDPLASRTLESYLRTAPGDAFDASALAADVDRLYGLSLYEHVGYRLVREGDRTGVEFRTREKSWGPNFLRFGLSLEDDFEGSTAFNLAGRLTATGLNSLGAEWRNDVRIGTEPYVASEFYQPFGFQRRLFVAPRVTLGQRNLNSFADGEMLARYRLSEAVAGVDVGSRLGNWGEFRAGLVRGTGRADVTIGDPSLADNEFDVGGVLTRLGIDTRDDAQIPKAGTRARVQWFISRTGLGGSSRFDTVRADVDHAWSWGPERRNTFQVGADYATTLDSDNTLQNFFTLGGFLRLSGLGRGEVSGPHSALARLVYYREFGEGRGFFDMPVYIGASVEAGNAWQSRSQMAFGDMLVNGSIFAGVDTYLGPMFVAAGISEGGGSNFYLFFGNPRSLAPFN